MIKNWDGDIYVQVKGRTTYLKSLSNNWKFDVDKSDLENYNKIDGTLFFAVRFLQDGTQKFTFGKAFSLSSKQKNSQ